MAKVKSLVGLDVHDEDRRGGVGRGDRELLTVRDER